MAKKKKAMKENMEEKQTETSTAAETVIGNVDELTSATSPNEPEPSSDERYEALLKEKSEAENKYLRLLAEFENYRRRNEKDRINWIKNANEKLALRICDVLDDFGRALEIKSEIEHFQSFYQGIQAIHTKLERILAAEGLEKMEAAGKEFDPMYHEAVSYIPSPQKADEIVAVVQNGYIMGNKVIRAAKVVVSAGES